MLCLVKMFKKRGQLTIFMILGITIIFIFASLFYYMSNSKKIVMEKELKKIVSLDTKNIQLFVESCLNTNTMSGLDFLEKQAGYIEYPEVFPFLQTPQGDVPLLYNQGQSNIIEISVMETDLSEYIKQNVTLCLNDFKIFEKDGIEFSGIGINVKASIYDNLVNVELEQDVTVKEGNNIFKLSDLNKNIPSKFKKAYEFAEMVVNALVEYDTPGGGVQFPEFVTNPEVYNDFLDSAGLSISHPLPTVSNFRTVTWQVVNDSLGFEFTFSTTTKESH